MYGVAALVLLHCGGALGEEVEGMLVGPLLMLSAAVGALAAGLPIWMLPAPLLAASGLAMFYETRFLRDYLLFVVGALATGGWAGAGAAAGRAAPAGCAGGAGRSTLLGRQYWGSAQRGSLSMTQSSCCRLPLCFLRSRRRLVCVAPLLVPGHHA